MKRVYFVRHGVTGGNEARSYQLLDTSLSETGRQQAAFLAERFTKIPFEALITSQMERAQETGRFIAQKTGHKVIVEPLFHEMLRPSVVRGKRWDDQEASAVMDFLREHWHDQHHRHSDEENFHDLKSRALAALSYLIARPEKTMVVITHGVVLKMMIATMIQGEKTDSDFFKSFDAFMYPQNTGITWCEYDNQFHPNRWQLITWNDHAHLG